MANDAEMSFLVVLGPTVAVTKTSIPWICTLQNTTFDTFFTSSVLLFSRIVEGSLEVKLPTIWTDGTAEVGRVREEKPGSEKSREEKE